MPNTTVGHFIRFFELAKLRPQKLADALDIKQKLLFTWKGWDELTFTTYGDNPYTPSEIAKVIARFRIEGGLVRQDEATMPEVVKILSYADYGPSRQMKREQESPRDHELWHIDGPAILADFKSFQRACVELSEAINVWLRKYEADGLNLK